MKIKFSIHYFLLNCGETQHKKRLNTPIDFEYTKKRINTKRIDYTKNDSTQRLGDKNNMKMWQNYPKLRYGF